MMHSKYIVSPMLEKNNEKHRVIQKIGIIVLISIMMSCVNSVEKYESEHTKFCITINDLNCDLHPDFNPEFLSNSFKKVETFRINIENSDITDIQINNGEALLPIVKALKEADEKHEFELEFCHEKSLGKKEDYIIKYSDAITYDDYSIFLVIIDLNESESLEYNLLYHNNELVYSSCNARFSLNN